MSNDNDGGFSSGFIIGGIMGLIGGLILNALGIKNDNR